MSDLEREYREAHATWLKASTERQVTLQEAMAADLRASKAWARLMDLAGRLPPNLREKLGKEEFVS
jgi:hypothetical protein